MLAAFAGTAPWTGLCFANAVIGFVLLLRQPRPIARRCLQLRPVAALPRVAIVMTVRNEDMRRVLPPLRRLLHDLDAGGAGGAFALFILSDTAGGERQRPNNGRWRHFAPRIAIRAASITAGARRTPASRPATSWISSTVTPTGSS